MNRRLILNRPKTALEYIENNILKGISVLILVVAASTLTAPPCRADEPTKQNALQKAAQEWILVGKEQYERSQFSAAKKSFQRAAVYRKYLNDADRKKLDELLDKSANAAFARELTSVGTNTNAKLFQPIQPAETTKVVPLDTKAVVVKPKARIIEPKADSTKEARFLTRKELEYIAEKPIQSNNSFAKQIKLPSTPTQSVRTKTPTNTVAGPRLVLEPGDEIEVKFFYTPELDIKQTVRPDGKISLQLIPEVTAQGKTVAELRQELKKLYDPYLRKPEIAVVARSFYNQRVFVGGQVLRPGVVEMPGQMTALEAIMEAGGFDIRTAQRKSVIVIRYSDGKRQAYKLDLNKAVVGKETKPFYLKPKDIVHVPRTSIAKLNQWIDQHINKIIPDTGFFYRQTSGDSTVGIGTYR